MLVTTIPPPRAAHKNERVVFVCNWVVLFFPTRLGSAAFILVEWCSSFLSSLCSFSPAPTHQHPAL